MTELCLFFFELQWFVKVGTSTSYGYQIKIHTFELEINLSSRCFVLFLEALAINARFSYVHSKYMVF